MNRMMLLLLGIALILLGSCHTEEHTGRNRRQAGCDINAEYRDVFNSCNNLNKPLWGSAFDRLHRSRPASYADGIFYPRFRGASGAFLPNPRVVSNTVHFQRKEVDDKHSTMLMQWGQFINHDIISTPNTTDSEGDITDCCKLNEHLFNQSTPASECFSVYIGNNDPYFRNNRCINFVRNQAWVGTGTSPNSPRSTYNGASAFIDGSMIYGNYPEITNKLRSKSGGRLKVVERNDGAFLPEGRKKNCINGDDPNSYCFLAGDERVNVFPGLSAMHTVFLREHNRLAAILAQKHPNWNDEKLYQETRKIVAAQLQVITYNQWLPLILGPFYTNIYGINSTYEYDSSINPRVSNAFSASAMRFGHSLVPDTLDIGGQTRRVADLISSTKEVLDSLEEVLEAITEGVNHEGDPWFVRDMTWHMFETAVNARDGYDIVSLNIQRGRDQGLPPYTEWRKEFCQLGTLTSFDTNVFYTRAATDLSKVYNSVGDVDLYSGSMSEWHVPGGVVGNTNACIIADQFMRIKYGDRFFWQTQNEKIGFNKDQREELAKVSLARILCDNTDINSIQSDVFLKNAKVPCSQIDAMDMSKW